MSSYRDKHCAAMDRIRVGLWREPELIASLPAEKANAALNYLVRLACEPTNATSIMFARRALARVPSMWLVDRIQQAAEIALSLQDQWECRRLLELYCCLDNSLAHRFANWCVESSDPEIAEAGRDFLDDPDGFRTSATMHLDKPLP